jgi:hypothetical protein
LTLSLIPFAWTTLAWLAGLAGFASALDPTLDEDALPLPLP